MQEVTINLSDELYQKVVNYARKKKLSVEEVILMSIIQLLFEELPDFQTQIESNLTKSS